MTRFSRRRRGEEKGVPVSEPKGNIELLLADEVAAMLRVPARWVYDAARAGRIPCRKVGRKVRFVREEVERWIELASRSTPTQGSPSN